MTPLLTVNQVSLSFGGLKALSNVTFSVKPGEIFAIIGPNGAGKTTLFNCLSGALHPDEGEIVFDGQRTDSLAPHQICKHGIARTFQIVKPFRGMTVAENVMVAALSHAGSIDAAYAAALDVLRDVGMTALAETDADELNVSDLRRLEIARALATRPKLLLLDEMLAGLTPKEASEMCEQIRGLPQRGIAVMVVEHSIPVVSTLCERAIVLNFGEVLSCGLTSDVIQDKRVREAYLGSDA